jgi:hypothetical protein
MASKTKDFLNWAFDDDIDGGMADVAFGAQIFGAASKFIGSKYQAKAQQSSMAYQSQLADINQQNLNLQADSIRLAGERQIGQVTRRAGDIKGLQRARLGASGIAMDSQSALDVMNRSDILKEIDAIEILKNAVAKEGATRMGATNYAMSSNTYATAASNINPNRGALGGLMADASTVASQWYYLKKSGGTLPLGSTFTI